MASLELELTKIFYVISEEGIKLAWVINQYEFEKDICFR